MNLGRFKRLHRNLVWLLGISGIVIASWAMGVPFVGARMSGARRVKTAELAALQLLERTQSENAARVGVLAHELEGHESPGLEDSEALVGVLRDGQLEVVAAAGASVSAEALRRNLLMQPWLTQSADYHVLDGRLFFVSPWFPERDLKYTRLFLLRELDAKLTARLGSLLDIHLALVVQRPDKPRLEANTPLAFQSLHEIHNVRGEAIGHLVTSLPEDDLFESFSVALLGAIVWLGLLGIVGSSLIRRELEQVPEEPASDELLSVNQEGEESLAA